MKRTEIREYIFKLLFRLEFNEAEDMPAQLELFFDSEDFSEHDKKYIRSKYDNVVEKISEIDKLIDDTAKGWNVSRLSKVDLTVLRLGIYELVYDDDIPTAVAIDEAVELAKRFGRDESGSFVNGILAKLAK